MARRITDHVEWSRLRHRGDWVVAKSLTPMQVVQEVKAVRQRLGEGAILITRAVKDGTFVVVAESADPTTQMDAQIDDEDIPAVVEYYDE